MSGARPMRRALALLLLAPLAGCTTVGSSVADACPESRALRCQTPPTCSFDRERGCSVCACKAWDARPAAESEKGGRPYQPSRDPAAGSSELAPPR